MDFLKPALNIKLYYWFRLLCEPLFWGPILITYIQKVGGMSLADVYFLEAVCILGMVFLQVPLGALADLLGRKKLLIIGMMFVFGETIIFALANNAAMIWLANILWSIGFSCISGADAALLYDTLKLLGREDEYKVIEGRAWSYRFLAAALTSITVGYLAAINLRLPLMLDVLVIAANLIICCFFVELPKTPGPKSSYIKLLKSGGAFTVKHKEVLWAIIFAVFIGVIAKIWFFTYNPYFEQVNLPLVYFGYIFCLLNLIAGLSSYFAALAIKKIGDPASVLLIILLNSLPILAMGYFLAPAAAFLVLLENIVRGYLNPFMGQLLQKYLVSKTRATVTSIQSAFTGLAGFFALLWFSYCCAAYSLAYCLQILGLASLGGGIILFFAYIKIFRLPPKKMPDLI